MRLKFNTELIKHGGLMFVAASLVNVLNLFFHLYMVRALNPIDYGILNSLLALLVVVSIPAGSIQTVITKSTSEFIAHDELGKIRFLLSHSIKKLSFVSIAVIFIFTFSAKYIASFLKIPSVLPVFITGIIISASIVTPLLLAGLQGLQKFMRLGSLLVASGTLKLILGILFVWLGFRVVGALGGFVITSIFSLVFSLFLLRQIFKFPQDQNVNLSKIYSYFWPTALTLFCFWSLVSMDIILVKHFFKPIEAGYYSVAQMVGKMVLFLPGAISMVMLPKAAGSSAKNKDTRALIKESLILTAILCGVASLFIVLFPSFVLRILSGKSYFDCIPLVRLFAVSMSFFSLVLLLLYYHLSVGNLRFIRSLVFFTFAQFVLIVFFHQTLAQVLWVLTINSVLLFIINLCLIKPKPLDLR